MTDSGTYTPYQKGGIDDFLKAMAIFMTCNSELMMPALYDTWKAMNQLRLMGLRDGQIWQMWDSGKSPYLEKQQTLFNPAVKK